jgi:hypothetical protein
VCFDEAQQRLRATEMRLRADAKMRCVRELY